MGNYFNSRHFRHCEDGIEINNNLINGPGVVGTGTIPTTLLYRRHHQEILALVFLTP